MLRRVLPSLLVHTCVALSATASSFSHFAGSIKSWQDEMIARAKTADPSASWTVDVHDRGRAVIVEDGDVWEKGCISVTLIEDGELTETRAAAISARTGSGIVAGSRYSAAALSFVLHARSPLVPTLRGDVRVFSVGSQEWYGGGLDLTPSYVEEDDCKHFHGRLADLCSTHGEADTYAWMKEACDDYFFLPCRGEHRGVGGVFFDDLTAEWAPAYCEALIGAALAADGPYLPIVERRRHAEFSEAQKQWQLLRRGRYIEFNLLYDRGVKVSHAATPRTTSPHVALHCPHAHAHTAACHANRAQFGLSPESVERVLVSSPPVVAFKYKVSADQPSGSPEAETLEVLRKPREWARVVEPVG